MKATVRLKSSSASHQFELFEGVVRRVEDLGGVKPQRAVFRSKADAVAWLTAEATVHGFVYEPPV